MPRSDRPLKARPARPLRPAARADRRGTASRKSGRGGTLLGMFIGIALGLALAAGVAFWLMTAGNPYRQAGPSKEPARDAGREPAKTAKAEPGVGDKPRFDFYKILPGTEEPKAQSKAIERAAPDKATAERLGTPEKAPDRVAKVDARGAPTPGAPDKAAKTGERFWLQAGSFAAESDAENLKARLAFGGWEANVQPATLPDKGIRYRVRLGPYDNTDELNRMKGELARRGFDVAVIKFDRAQ